MQIKLDEKTFTEVLSKLKKMIYEYNSKIKEFGIYLKPYHAVYKNNRKYIYIGKYWYKLEWNKGRLKWIYLGKRKPIEGIPDPPKVPEATIIIDSDGNYIVESKLIDELRY
jgi:hypothetical protein